MTAQCAVKRATTYSIEQKFNKAGLTGWERVARTEQQNFVRPMPSLNRSANVEIFSNAKNAPVGA